MLDATLGCLIVLSTRVHAFDEAVRSASLYFILFMRLSPSCAFRTEGNVHVNAPCCAWPLPFIASGGDQDVSWLMG